MKKLPATTKAYFIKLGEGGQWEADCLGEGIIKFGYRETSHDECLNGEWDKVRALWANIRKDAGTGTRDARQIQAFYEADEQAIFITFAKGYLWWCHPTGIPRVLTQENNARVRSTVDGWKSVSVGGHELKESTLSGKLTKTQMFRGTICDVGERAYLLRRINDEQTPELAEALRAEEVLLTHMLNMIRLLDHRDFELLVDLIFSQSGWRRQTRTGGSRRTVDLDLLLPTTGERAFVQVKSETDTGQFDDYAERFDSAAHTRMFYVWHTGVIKRDPPPSITLWGPDVIASKVLEAGLLAWLKDRVS